MNQDKAEELFLWIVANPEHCDVEDKKQQLAHAFEHDPETVLHAVKSVTQKKENLFTPLPPSRYAYIPASEDNATHAGTQSFSPDTPIHQVHRAQQDKKQWTNCIGQQPFTPKETQYPSSLSDLVTIINHARDKQLRVRAIGSGHSFSDITNAQDAILAGIKVADLNTALDARGLALINMGAYDGQTISGALSTGTHGSGVQYGPMADSILSIVLVTESGQVYQIEPSSENGAITDPTKFPGYLPEAPSTPVILKQDDDWFRAAKIAMGCLGLIYSYTLRVCEAFSLSERREMTTWESVQSSWPPSNFSSKELHYELLINPYAEKKTNTHNCITVKRERITQPTEKRGSRLSWWNTLLEKFGVDHYKWLVDFLNWVPSASPAAINRALGFLPDFDPPYVDVSHEVFTLGIENTVPAWALELHFGFDASSIGGNAVFKDVIGRVLGVFERLGREKGWFIAGPVGVRFVRGSEAFLAPQQQGHGEGEGVGEGWVTCTVECDMLNGIRNDRELLGAIKQEICGVTGTTVRVHWGLDWGFTTPEDVRKWYPDLGRWQAIYREVNSGGMFDNVFTERLKLRE